jgi:uncharacterized membrane protein
MSETAKHAIAKGAVEQTLGHAKESATEAIGDLSGRLKDADVVQQIRKRTRQELKHAKQELKKASKQAQKRAKKAAKKAAKKRGRSKSRGRSRIVPAIVLLGGIAAVVYLMRRRRAASTTTAEVAPDPFGAALQEERAQSDAQRPLATPGA